MKVQSKLPTGVKALGHRGKRGGAASPGVRIASVAEAKANLSSLLQEVQQHRREITVLRRGVPVAKIVPVAEPSPLSGYGWMRGTAQELGDIVGPTGEEWDVSDGDQT